MNSVFEPKKTRLPSFDPRKSRMHLVLLAAALSAGFVTGGCRHRLDDFTAAELNKPEVRHPIGYRRQREALLVEIGGKGEGLSYDQQADVYRFLKKYRAESNGPITVSSPASPGAHLASTRTRKEIIGALRASGIPERGIVRDVHHDGEADFGPAIKLAYSRPVAVAPDCGLWPDNLGSDRERIHHQNFGCAAQRNLALTVANSRDLQTPQPSSPRSSERRSTTWADYVGKPKGSGGGDSGGTDAPASPIQTPGQQP